MKLKRKNGTTNMKTITVSSYTEIPENYTGKVYVKDPFFQDKLEYYKDGKLHREDGAAVKYEDGFRMFYLEGKTVYCQSDFEEIEKEWIILSKTKSKYKGFDYAEALTEIGIQEFFIKINNKPEKKHSEEEIQKALEYLKNL